MISFDDFLLAFPDLVSDAIRERDTRPPSSTHLSITQVTGTAMTVTGGEADVQFDDDPAGSLSSVQLAVEASPGDRLVMLLKPNGGAVAIGNGSLGGGSGGGGGGTDEYDTTFGL